MPPITVRWFGHWSDAELEALFAPRDPEVIEP